MPKVVTANTLATGRVVFLAKESAWVEAPKESAWVEAIEQARRFDDADAAEDGLARAQTDAEKAIIVEPFVADIVGEQNGRPKMTLRDTIRAYGPTISYHRNGAGGPAKGA